MIRCGAYVVFRHGLGGPTLFSYILDDNVAKYKATFK